MALRKLVRRNYGGKSPVSIKYENLHSFKKGVILLCQSILETRRILHLHGSALLTILLRGSSDRYHDCASLHTLVNFIWCWMLFCNNCFYYLQHFSGISFFLSHSENGTPTESSTIGLLCRFSCFTAFESWSEKGRPQER